MSLIDDLIRLNTQISEAPPVPRAILTNHAVPYGRAFRQWDTKGNLYVWVNPGVLHDLWRAGPPDPTNFSSIANFGIPVVAR